MGDYVPIACAEHERLEFAVLRRQRMRMVFRDESGVEHALTVLPTDVATRNGAEWLSYRDAQGVESVVRLDRILSAQPA